jgi:hypothetical protein
MSAARSATGRLVSTQGGTPDSAAHVKTEHAASAARPWPSVEKPTVRTDRPDGTGARPLTCIGPVPQVVPWPGPGRA